MNGKFLCPFCQQEQIAGMDIDSCLYFWKCKDCEKIIKPLEGDCCVFCSYGETNCLPKYQEEKEHKTL